MADNNTFKTLWARVTGWCKDPANQHLYVPIPADRTDRQYNDKPLQPMRSYFRLWLCEMFLTNRREWFTTWYPAVHSSVQLKFGDQTDVNFSNVANAPRKALTEGVLLNYSLTELMPFNGGSVDIESELLALKGTNYLEATIGILQGFSSLITAPLGQVLDIAEKVSSGIDTLLGATNGNVHLAFHQSFTSAGGGGGNELRPGYSAVILATAAEVKPDELRVKNDRLYLGDQPFRGYDYMLFRVEGRDERDDWRLRNIEEPLNKAIEASMSDETEKAEAYKKVALATALTSPDLAVYDRRRVVQAIKDELQYVAGVAAGAGAPDERDLQAIMDARAINLNEAAALGEMTFDELAN